MLKEFQKSIKRLPRRTPRNVRDSKNQRFCNLSIEITESSRLATQVNTDPRPTSLDHVTRHRRRQVLATQTFTKTMQAATLAKEKNRSQTTLYVSILLAKPPRSYRMNNTLKRVRKYATLFLLRVAQALVTNCGRFWPPG